MKLTFLLVILFKITLIPSCYSLFLSFWMGESYRSQQKSSNLLLTTLSQITTEKMLSNMTIQSQNTNFNALNCQRHLRERSKKPQGFVVNPSKALKYKLKRLSSIHIFSGDKIRSWLILCRCWQMEGSTEYPILNIQWVNIKSLNDSWKTIYQLRTSEHRHGVR